MSHNAHSEFGDGRLLSVNEVAAAFGISRRSVYRLVKERELPASRVGERLRFRPAHIEEYLDSREVGASP